MLEISTHDYGSHNERLTKKMQNGLNEQYRISTQGSAYNYSMEIAGILSLQINLTINQNELNI